ncbi:unnamed protein product [Alopecurus aequalis]
MASCSRRNRGGDGNQTRAASWPSSMARYVRLEKLGAGINGEVFKAWDTQASEIVAVKRLSATGTDGFIISGLPEVLRERKSLTACRGVSSIVQLRDVVVPAIQSHGDPYIIMDYAGRLNLRSYMQLRARCHRPFSEAEVRRIMKQLLKGVKFVHDKDILHLDLKPENVILDDGTEDRMQRPKAGAIQDGKLKEDSIVYTIGGFGMSRKKERTQTQQPVIILTPYSAPELLLRSCEYGDRVDTWGLGCIMAELLECTGIPTFDGASDIEIMSKVDGIVGTSKLTRDQNHRRLRRQFPRGKLSSAGFEVLSGLLECNPEKRLTAEDALEKPWFHKWRRGFGGCFS